jgi:hypothetical protein
MAEPSRSYRGCLVVGGIFLLALASTGGSLWYRYSETREALKLWGSQSAQAISAPDKMEALWLGPGTGAGDLQADGASLRIVATRDVTKAPGFSNARNALVLNRSYELEPPPCVPTWTHALRFTRGNHQVTLLFSLECPRAMLSGSGKITGITNHMAKGLKQLLAEEEKRGKTQPK